MPHDCRPRCPQRTRTPQKVPPPTSPPGAWHAPPPARRPHSRVQHAAWPPPAPCAQSRPRDDPGVPRSRGMRAGGRPTSLPVHALQPPPPCVLSPDPVTTPGLPVPGGCVRGGRQTESRPRDDPRAPRPRGMRARGAPDRTAPSPPRGDHDQHSHTTRPALPPRRPPRSPWRTCRPHRLLSPPSTPHPVDDAPTLELMPCLTRGRAGALRGRHTATTY